MKYLFRFVQKRDSAPDMIYSGDHVKEKYEFTSKIISRLVAKRNVLFITWFHFQVSLREQPTTMLLLMTCALSDECYKIFFPAETQTVDNKIPRDREHNTTMFTTF